MARIRTIKPEFFTSEQVVECSPMARLLFVGMWCFCDDGGVHPASAVTLKMEVFPADSISADDVRGYVKELESTGLLSTYQSNGKSFWRVLGWHHQKIDRPTYKHPRSKEFGEYSARSRRTLGEESTPESNGVEWSRVEGSIKEAGHISANGKSSQIDTHSGDEVAKSKHGKQIRFTKPTLEEVEAYCDERGNIVPAQAFIDHYESCGWVVGKGKPMKDWKAAIRSVWEPNHRKPESRVPTAEDLANWNPVDAGLGR